MESYNIGFINIIELEPNKEIVGGLLITNSDGYPGEIRYSEGIKLTTLERITYGLLLNSRIFVEKIALPLIQKSENFPEIIFVKDKNLLKIQKKINKPLIVYFNSNYSENSEIENFKFKFEFDQNKNELESNNIIQSFIKGNTLEEDLDEPFERIKKALEYIDENKKI